MDADEIREIPIGDLCEPFIVMRPVVKDSVEFLERVDSLARNRFLNSVLVRPSSRKPGKYEIVDGLWRYTAAQEVPFITTIPCIIKAGLSDEDALAQQIQANAVRAETTTIEYSRQLRRILDRAGGTMTVAELARIAGKHPTWVKDRLGLLDLAKDVQTMVDRGEIPATSAFSLAKIPSHWRRDYIERARTMKVRDFQMLAAGVVKQFSECVAQGKLDDRFLPEFKPQAYLRGLKEVRGELETPQVGATLIVSEGAKTALDGWNAALRWALHLDRQSVEDQRLAAQRKTRTRILKHHEAANETPVAD